MSELIFNQSPIIEIASNKFINVPVILKYEDLNLIEVVQDMTVGYATKIPIYHSDGTYLGVAINSRFYSTDEGKKAGVIIDKRPDLWVCKMNGKELFEIRQQNSNEFKTTAEIFTNDGYIIKIDNNPIINYNSIQGESLNVGGGIFVDNTFSNLQIGIHVTKESIMIGGM